MVKGFYRGRKMLDQNKQALSYALTISSRIQKICEPLFNNLHFKLFVYVKVLPNGKMLHLTSCADWTRIFYENEFYNADDCFNNIRSSMKENENKTFILSGKPTDKHCCKLFEYGVWNTCSYYRKLNNTIEGWAFGGYRENYQTLDIYMNYPSALCHFIQYFNEKAQEFIDCSDESKLIDKNAQKVKLPCIPNTWDKYVNDVEVSHFPLRVQGVDVKITTRELSCLRLLALGLSIKEIARIMHISPRTVESFLKLIKYKTKSNKKIDLIHLYHRGIKEWI